MTIFLFVLNIRDKQPLGLSGGNVPVRGFETDSSWDKAASLLSPTYAPELSFSGKVFQKALQLERLIGRRDDAKQCLPS